ncbi:hypothetical protein PIB30_045633 [Stylosanthes scabra]|uniref:Uncharacterized protein n=1 Tax=Stylosanthes scabra TaxID=79078 RepID=A0ABU6VGW9_9FABA|nr:hypothetical protein [Stylosanthes scabra]
MAESAQPQGKGIIDESPLHASLKIHSRDLDAIIDDPEDAFNSREVLFPIAVEDKTYCFYELLVKNDMMVAPFESSTRFRNDPKLGSKKASFISWIDRLKSTYGLPPTGRIITYDLKPTTPIDIEFVSGYGDFISLHMGKFGSKKSYYIPLAILLHESKSRLCLAKFLLGHLYDELGLLVEELRKGSSLPPQTKFNERNRILARNKEALKCYKPTDCEPSNFVTKGHIQWWDAYYKPFIKSLQEINEGIQRKWDAAELSKKVPQKRKAEPSKQPTKRTRGSSKASSVTSNPQEGLPQNSVSSSTRLPTIEDSQQDSDASPKEVSSKSKESPLKNPAHIEVPNQNRPGQKDHSPPTDREGSPDSSKGAKIQNADVSGIPANKNVGAQNVPNSINSTTDGGDDLLVVVQNSDDPKPKDAQVILKSKGPTSQIPIIVQGDSDLEDLVKQISTPVSEKKAEVAKKRLESSINKLLISAAEKMIRLLSHSIYEIQNNEELTFELTRVSSCLVENQFPPECREKVKLFNVIFSNLIRTRDRLNLIRNEAANAKENNDNLIAAEETMKEKCSRYEKHLEEASLTLESYSKDRKDLEKELAAIQAKIKDIDDKVARIRVPFEKTQSKKQELDANLARIAESKTEAQSQRIL